MSFASNMQNVADSLITKYGNDIEIIEVQKGTYNPTTGKDSATTVVHPFKAYVSNFTVEEMDSDNFTIDDFKVMVQTDLPITRDWLVSVQGVHMKIISKYFITTQNESITQTLQVRAVV